MELVSLMEYLLAPLPSADARPHQLVRDADTPPSRWPEAAHADGGMAERLAGLC